MGRLVLNHSTMLPGLVRVLKRISESTSIDTIVPGRIYHATKSQQTATTGSILQLKLTTSSNHNSSSAQQLSESDGITSQKIIARTASQAQEVFLSMNKGIFKSSQEIKTHLESFLQKEKGVEVILQQRADNGAPRKTKSLMEMAINRRIDWR